MDRHNRFEYIGIPVDDNDARYCQSFDPEEASEALVQEFFETYGFAVFRNVVTKQVCRDTISDMWDLLEEMSNTDDVIEKLDRSKPDTWTNRRCWTSYGMPKGCHALFRPALLRLRQDPEICKCFFGILQSTNILCSHDRWLMHRPNATKSNVHLDLNPWEFFDSGSAVRNRLSSLRYGLSGNRAFVAENNIVHKSMGRVVQGILTLTDLSSTSESSGGTIVVPGSHAKLERWVRNNERNGVTHERVTDQNTFGADTLRMAQRVCMRPGSLLIWDQRLIHGSTTNRSERLRCGVPIRYFNAGQMDEVRAKDRASDLRHQILGFEDELTDLGRQVFGLTTAGQRSQT